MCFERLPLHDPLSSCARDRARPWWRVYIMFVYLRAGMRSLSLAVPRQWYSLRCMASTAGVVELLDWALPGYPQKEANAHCTHRFCSLRSCLFSESPSFPPAFHFLFPFLLSLCYLSMPLYDTPLSTIFGPLHRISLSLSRIIHRRRHRQRHRHPNITCYKSGANSAITAGPIRRSTRTHS